MVNPYQFRNMLRTYSKQLVSARRLARFQRHLRLSGAEDQVSISREAKRKALIEKVAKEVIDNLLVTGVENPTVEEIKSELEEHYGYRFLFEYPFMEQDLQIFRDTEQGPERLSPDETTDVLSKLWQITLDRVDETML